MSDSNFQNGTREKELDFINKVILGGSGVYFMRSQIQNFLEVFFPRKRLQLVFIMCPNVADDQNTSGTYRRII